MNQEEIVKALLRPEAYDEKVKKIRALQTHISYVFLTGKYAYKIKKPVNFGFLDFSTLEKRKQFCELEVQLNSRLSPHVYLGTVPVIAEGGRLRFGSIHDGNRGGDGDTVDWAVVMNKIPMEKSMKKLAEQNKLTRDIIDSVAWKIAEFHKSAETSPEIEKYGSIAVVKKNTDENFEQTEKYIGVTISEDTYYRLFDYTEDFYRNNADIFQGRIQSKKIRDCHGDLHMEHICITEPITIFDCIEFNYRFRYSDTAADIAFLAMDMDFHGLKSLSEYLIERYMEYSGDHGLRDILDFYKIYRAYVRGKVISFRLDDPHIPEHEKEWAKKEANSYFKLAESYIR